MSGEKLHQLCAEVRKTVIRYGYADRNSWTDFDEGIAHQEIVSYSLGLMTDIWFSVRDLKTIGIFFEVDSENAQTFLLKRFRILEHIEIVTQIYLNSVIRLSEEIEIDDDVLVGFQRYNGKWDKLFQPIDFYATYLEVKKYLSSNKPPQMIKDISKQIGREITSSPIVRDCV